MICCLIAEQDTWNSIGERQVLQLSTRKGTPLRISSRRQCEAHLFRSTERKAPHPNDDCLAVAAPGLSSQELNKYNFKHQKLAAVYLGLRGAGTDVSISTCVRGGGLRPSSRVISLGIPIPPEANATHAFTKT